MWFSRQRYGTFELVSSKNALDILLERVGFLCNIANTSDSVSSGYPNTEKIVDNTTRSGVFLTKFEVFGYPIKHGLECLIYLLSRNKN